MRFVTWCLRSTPWMEIAAYRPRGLSGRTLARQAPNGVWMSAVAAVCLSLVVWTTSFATTESADELLQRARDAAAHDRHREAIDLYLRAVEQDSLLRPTVSLELGHQYTWAEIPDSAVIWYGIYLGDHPGDFEARLGVARALSWGDRLSEAEKRYTELLPEAGEQRDEVLLALAKTNAWQEDYGEAEKIYRSVIEEDSTQIDATLGLAETMNWSGKHRQAGEVLQAVLDRDPENVDAVKGLAESQLWMGRPDRALETLDEASARGVRNVETDRLAGAIRGSRRAWGDGGYAYRENTDDGVIRTASASIMVPIDDLTEVGGKYAKSRLTQLGYPDIDRHEVTLSAARRFSEGLAAVVAPGYQLNRFDPTVATPGAGPVDDFDLFVWDVYVTVTPRDWVRIDAGTSRETMDIPLPVFKQIRVTTENAGLDWRPAHRFSTFWEAMYSSYSDGNSRIAATERLEWLSPWRIDDRDNNRFVLLQGVEYSTFDEQLDNGYFSPESYVYTFGGVRFITDIGKRAYMSLDGRFGGEKESGDGWASVGSFEGTLRYRASASVVLVGGYYKSGSRLDSPDGFRAEGFYLTLTYGGSP